MIPIEEVADADPYTDEDLTAALGKLNGRSKVFLQFLMATGCRAVEAVRLTWDHVKDDHIVIDGKRVRTATTNMRVIPFALCPELPEILAEASQATWGKGERVFGAQNYQVPARAFSEALSGKGRGFHDVRKWAINKWVRMGWPERVIEAVAGHDTAISKKHYRTPFTASDLTSMLRSETESTPAKKARKKADSL
jgi:integrase